MFVVAAILTVTITAFRIFFNWGCYTIQLVATLLTCVDVLVASVITVLSFLFLCSWPYFYCSPCCVLSAMLMFQYSVAVLESVWVELKSALNSVPNNTIIVVGQHFYAPISGQSCYAPCWLQQTQDPSVLNNYIHGLLSQEWIHHVQWYDLCCQDDRPAGKVLCSTEFQMQPQLCVNFTLQSWTTTWRGRCSCLVININTKRGGIYNIIL